MKTAGRRIIMISALAGLLACFFSTTVKAGIFSSLQIEDMKQTGLKQATITWEGPDEYDGFVIKRTWVNNAEASLFDGNYDLSQEEEEGVKWTIIKQVDGGNIRSAVVDVKPGEKYYYCVQGFEYYDSSKNYNGRYSSNGSPMYPTYRKVVLGGRECMLDQHNVGHSVLFAAQVPTTKITGLKKASGSSATLSWEKVKDATGYQILCKESGKNGYKIVTTVSADTFSYLHKGLVPGHRYTYGVKCIYGKEYTSEMCAPATTLIPNVKGKKKIVTQKKVKMLFKDYVYSWSFASSDYTYYYEEGKYFYIVTVNGSKLTQYKLDQNMKLKGSKKVKLGKYDEFGTFYHGIDGQNYVALGYNNHKEKDSKVVLKVLQYSGKWKKKKTASFKGGVENSFKGIYEPIHASGAQMTMQGRWLYLTMGRQMYIHDDGKRHQSNIAFRIDTTTMKGSEHNVAYVSHSFNQLAQYHGNDLYQIDHGDAYPRCVVLTIHRNDAMEDKNTKDNFDTKVEQYNVFDLQGSCGENFTGMQVGGFGIGGDNVVVTGIAQPHNYAVGKVKGYGGNLGYNVFVSVVNTKTKSKKVIWLTKYNPKKKKGTQVSEARMVPLCDDRFAILWNETKGKKTVLKYQVVDSNGKVVYKKTYKNTPFDPGSQPILTNGYIQWVSGQRGTKVVKTFWYSYTTYTDTVGKPKTVRIPAKY